MQFILLLFYIWAAWTLPAAATPSTDRNCGQDIIDALLGEAQPTGLGAWFSQLLPDDQAWPMADHQVSGEVIFPGAGFMANALAIAQTAEPGATVFILENFGIRQALRLSNLESCTQYTQLLPRKKKQLYVTCGSSNSNGVKSLHALSDVRALQIWPDQKLDFRTLAPTAQTIDTKDLYRFFGRLGLIYGPYFKRLETLRVDGWQMDGTVSMPVNSRLGTLDPALIDGALQTLIAPFYVATSTTAAPLGMVLPNGFSKIVWSNTARETSGIYKVEARFKADPLQAEPNSIIYYDLRLLTQAGHPVLEIIDGELRAIPRRTSL